MKVNKISEIRIIPTDRKIQNAQNFVESTGILPKEMPVEKTVYFEPVSNMMARIKDSIQIAIDNMRK